MGDVIAADGEVIGGPHDEQGRLLRSTELIAHMGRLPDWPVRPGESTTLVCVLTDASVDKRGCGIIARMTTAGLARGVDPVFSPFDGDVVFCLASAAILSSSPASRPQLRSPDCTAYPGCANTLGYGTGIGIYDYRLWATWPASIDFDDLQVK